MNIYIFKCSNGTYKIGKANDIAIRKIEVEKQYGITAETVAWKTIDDTLKFENMLHRKFQHYRANIGSTREFFNLSKQQIDNLIQEHCFVLSSNAIKSQIGQPPMIVYENKRCPQDIERIEQLENELKEAKRVANVADDNNSWFVINYQINVLKSRLWSESSKEDRILIIELIDGLEMLLTSYDLPKPVQEIDEKVKIKSDDAILERSKVYLSAIEFTDDNEDRDLLLQRATEGFENLIKYSSDPVKVANYRQEINKLTALDCTATA